MIDPMRQSRVPSRTMTIREFADTFGITPRAVRFYEDKGLLSPPRDGNARIFGDNEKVRLARILRAKEVGFSLEEIRMFMEIEDGAVMDQLDLMKRKRAFQHEIKSLHSKRDMISVVISEMEDMCGKIDKALESPSISAVDFQYAAAFEAAMKPVMEDDYSSDDPQS